MSGETEPAVRWEPQQLGAFVDQVKNDRFLALWMLAATTGVPFGSLVSLRREDVDLKHQQITPAMASSTTASPPGPSYRLEPDTYDALRQHVVAWERERPVIGVDSSRLFIRGDGQPLDVQSAMHMFAKHCAHAGVPVVTINDVRLAYVLAALESGIPTRTLRDRLARGPLATPSAATGPGTDPTPNGRRSVKVGRSDHRAQQMRGAHRQATRATRGRRL